MLNLQRYFRLPFYKLPLKRFVKSSSINRHNIASFSSSKTRVLPFYNTKRHDADDRSNGIKMEFLQNMKELFGLKAFVETGIFQGNTTACAAKIFDKVLCIEFCPAFYEHCKKRFANEQKIQLYLGDSGKLLKEVLSFCDNHTLLYLDAHYDGPSRGGIKAEKNTPVLQELEQVRLSKKTPIILIDDLCDFLTSIYPERLFEKGVKSYPLLTQVIEHILLIHPDYQICVMGDSLLAFLPQKNVTVSKCVEACSRSYFSHIAPLFSKEEVQRAERVIGSVQGEERKELIDYYHSLSNCEYCFGWPSFSSFWYGLLLEEEGKALEAQRLFWKTAVHSHLGWGVHKRLRYLILPKLYFSKKKSI